MKCLLGQPSPGSLRCFDKEPLLGCLAFQTVVAVVLRSQLLPFPLRNTSRCQLHSTSLNSFEECVPRACLRNVVLSSGFCRDPSSCGQVTHPGPSQLVSHCFVFVHPGVAAKRGWYLSPEVSLLWGCCLLLRKVASRLLCALSHVPVAYHNLSPPKVSEPGTILHTIRFTPT